MPTFHTSHSLSYCLLQVFDFHHQKFCPGDFNEKEALLAAVATWPSGVRPVVHWSESEEGRRPHAHSDYITVSISLCLFPSMPCLSDFRCCPRRWTPSNRSYEGATCTTLWSRCAAAIQSI